jgi:hypothetical protein
VVFLAGTLFAGFNDTAFNSFFFMQLTDPQFGMYEEPKPYPKETANFNLAIDHVNRLKPPFIVLTGDNVHGMSDTAQLNAFKKGLARLDPSIPVFQTPGNHDIGSVPTQPTINTWKSRSGPDRQAFVYNRCLFILLNSPLIKDSTGYALGFRQQRTWLDSVLNAADSKHHARIFIVQHHSYFLKTATEANGYSNIDMPRRTEYLTLFKKHNVTAVFAGHLHNTAEGKDGTLSMVTTGPVGKPLGTGISGLRIIKVYADSVRWPFYGLNAVPQKIDMPVTAITPLSIITFRPEAPERGGLFNAAGRRVGTLNGAAGVYLVPGTARTPSKRVFVEK